MPTRVMVTGAAGMIGSHLCDRLMEAGAYEIIAIDDLSIGRPENIEHHLSSARFRFVKADVREADQLRAVGRGVQIIVHLAARKKIGEHQAGIETLTVNTRGTENVLELARLEGAKVVLASTSDVYGMSPDLPFREDGDLVLGPSMVKRWSYAVGKLYCEQLAYAYYKDYGLPIVVLRYFGGFSERASFSWSGGHVPVFIDAILRGEPVIIHGDGRQTRSMAYVEDLIDGTVLAMHEPTAVGEIINLGNPEEMSVLDCARKIHAMVSDNSELRLKFIRLEEIFGEYRDIQRRRPDIAKARKILGWEPKRTFEDGLRITIRARLTQLSGRTPAAEDRDEMRRE